MSGKNVTEEIEPYLTTKKGRGSLAGKVCTGRLTYRRYAIANLIFTGRFRVAWHHLLRAHVILRDNRELECVNIVR